MGTGDDDFDWDDDVQRNDGGLAEVERALSVLGGRHPEVVRQERLAREAAEKRRKEIEAAAIAERKRARTRLVVAGLVVAALGGAGAFGYTRYSKLALEEGRVAPVAASYVASGFSLAPHGTFAAQSAASADVGDRQCVAVVQAQDLGDAPISVTHAGKTESGAGSLLFCTCASEHVDATASGPVRILTIDAKSIGGLRAAGFLSPRPKTVLASGEACGAEAFAAWTASEAAPKATVPEVPKVLAEAGFTGVASSPPPFGVVRAPAGESCTLATSDAPITLEAADGSASATGKSLAWCETDAKARVVSGSARFSSWSVPAARIGGMLGVREIAQRAGFGDVATFVEDADLGPIARDCLKASVVPDPAVATGSLTRDQTSAARVLAFLGRPGGTAAKGTAVVELGSGPTYDPELKPGVSVACTPSVTDALEGLCVVSGPLGWRPHAALSASGAAFGPLPYWMGALEPFHTQDVVALELSLVMLARRLTSRGFDPTLIEGVSEKPRGVEVLGRSGEDAIVAVGLWPAPPYVVPYTDGAPWTLDSEPNVISLAGGARVTLSAPMTPTASEKARRTVVFRHGKH